MTNNILVTGATGFIGSHLVDHLSQNPDNKIYGLSRSIKEESTFKALKLSERYNVNLIFGNVNLYSNIEEAIAKFDIDHIYHLASQPIVQIAAKAPVPTYTTNVLGTLNVLETARIISQQTEKRISILVMSSDKAYGNSEFLPYKEDFPLNGSDVYSSSKSCQDIMARTYAYNYDMNITVARPANTYGFDFQWTRLIPTLAKTFLDKDNKEHNKVKELILNKGSYHYIREFNYVKDTVTALETLIHNIDKTKGQAYNIGSGEKLTTEQLVNKFIEIVSKYCSTSDVSIQFKDKAKTFKEIPEQYLDSTKIINTTRWKPKYSLETGLKCTIDEYKNWFCTE